MHVCMYVCRGQSPTLASVTTEQLASHPEILYLHLVVTQAITANPSNISHGYICGQELFEC